MKCAEIREVILSLKRPFGISDLFCILEEKNSNVDRDAALQVLDELYDEKLVEYKKVRDGLWAFYVA